MIDRERIVAAFEAQVESITQMVATVPEGELVWASGLGADFDYDALLEVAGEWHRMGSGGPPSDGASFVAGFLTAMRVSERSGAE